jgi:hypothetical protein
MHPITVLKGDTIHCNRCDKAFAAPKEMPRFFFCGTKAARIDAFSKCPHCGQNDSHWVYARDVLPAFQGGFDKRKQAQRRWLQAN